MAYTKQQLIEKYGPEKAEVILEKNRERARKWAAENKERQAANVKRYREEHPDCRKKEYARAKDRNPNLGKDRYWKNPERSRELSRESYERNKEKRLEEAKVPILIIVYGEEVEVQGLHTPLKFVPCFIKTRLRII